MLSYYGIKNTGVKLTNKTDIIHVKCPFIAHLDDGFALVVSINEKYASYIEDNSLKNKRVSIDSFKRSWTGNLLLVEPQTNSQGPGFRNHRNEEYLRNGKTILFFLSIAFVLIEFTYHNIIKASSKFSFCILLFSIVGTSICMLLVNRKINRGFADRFCSLSNTMNCNKVLDSKIFSISGFIDLTDIGLGFFISNIVIVCIFPVFTKYLVVINLLGFPFTIWSIWYQKFKVKEWCPLCLSVIFTLWGIYYSAFAFNKWIGIGAFYFIDFLLTGSIFIIIILGISYLTSILQDSKDLVKATYEIKQIKFNESVFWTLLYKQDYYPESELHPHILISNTQSDHSITILVNPHCTPCALMHQRIQSFLKKNPNISVRYIFSSFHNFIV
ncbi:vitamin K epoxide reductase family protein [Porphyromonadaceae bacterium W3.11]|nr:vitamin K epoxide reductase family protein [Porphyromonadaceae bacterium W3.11]